MRIIAGVALAIFTCLVIWLPVTAHELVGQSATDIPTTDPTDSSEGAPGEGSGSQDDESETDADPRFTGDNFFYIPPPPTVPARTLFYSGTFKYVPAAEGEHAGRLVRPVWGAIQVSTSDSETRISEPQNPDDPTNGPTATSAPTNSLTPSNTATSTTTSTDQPTPPTPTGTSTSVPTPSPSPSHTPVSTPTATPTSTPIPTTTPTPTSTSTSVPTPSPSPSPSHTPLSTPTATSTFSVISEAEDGGKAPEATAAPTMETVSTQTMVDETSGDSEEIEDPRFYSGSYSYGPETRTLQPLVKGLTVTVPTIKLQPRLGGCAGNDPAGATPCQTEPSSSRNNTLPRRGRAMYYNPGIMEIVLSFRLEAGHVTPCPECVGYVALLHREDLNRRVWIEWENGDVEGPFLVIDAAAAHHIPSLLSRNWVVDVDYQTAIRRSMNGPLPVTVWDSLPRTTVRSGSNIPGASFVE